jgi:hypothetical protein
VISAATCAAPVRPGLDSPPGRHPPPNLVTHALRIAVWLVAVGSALSPPVAEGTARPSSGAEAQGAGRSGASAGSQRACPATTPADAQPVDAASGRLADALVGTWSFTAIRTTRGLPPRVSRSTLTLQPTDSAALYYRGLSPEAPRLVQPLTGVFRSLVDTASQGKRTPWRLRRQALVADDSRPCLDCSAPVYRIAWVAPGAFGGSWTQRFESVELVGPDGRTHASVEGRFCAWRTAAQATPGS